MATRVTYGSATVGEISGDDLMDNIGAHIGRLYDASCLPLTSVAGVDDVTATLDPVLLAGLVDGMKVTLSWPAANTGAMTLALNGGAATPIVDVNGAAMVAATVEAGQRALLEYVGGSWRLLNASSGSGGGVAPRYRWQFDASGTWTKPTDLDDDTLVTVELWGGGGGGSSYVAGGAGGGGGGGAYTRRNFRLGDLAASVSITVAAGGAVGAAGSASSFGALCSAFGGGRGGYYSSSGYGGGGGSSGGAGGNANQNSSQSTVTPGGSVYGGTHTTETTDESGGVGGIGGDAGDSFYGGGGGSGRTGTAGNSVYGGGGGRGYQATGGGSSVYGGSGGADGVAASVPGGGGGRGAVGAAGRVVVWC